MDIGLIQILTYNDKNTCLGRLYVRNVKNWYSRRLSDPQAMGLLAICCLDFIAIYFLGDLIAPLLIAIVLAYLLEMPINFLTKKLKFPRMLATLIIFGGFLTYGVINFLWTSTNIMESNDFLIKRFACHVQ